MTSNARTALAFASLGHGLCHGSRLVLPVVLLTAASDLGVTEGRLALALTSYGVAIGVCSVPAGLLADRWGPTRALLLYFWVLAAAAALCAVSTGYLAFLAAHTLLGAAAGLYHPPGLTLLSLSTTRDERGAAMGWHGVLGQVGIACAPLIVLAVAPHGGWRGAYLVLAATAVLGALWGRWLAARGRLLAGVPARHEVASEGTLDRGALLLLLGVMSMNGFLLDGFTTLFPTTVAQRNVQPLPGAPLSAEVVAAVILGLSAVGQWLGGRLARGAHATRRYLWMLLLQPMVLLASAATLGLAHGADGGAGALSPHGAGGLAGALSSQGAFVLFAAFAFANYTMQPLENHLLAGFTGTARRGAAFALKFSVAWIFGAAAPPLVVAIARSSFAASRGGDALGYAALGVAAVVGAACGVLFVRRVLRAAATSTA